ncbi:MAG TPA: methionyl-tRNA formyltransferase [Candidatus Saccharimonadales bacterium]
MKNTSKTIVFFGSGPVAAKSLELLLQHISIEVVITKPRLKHHKGDVPVLELAERLGIPVMTAVDKRSLDELFASDPAKSELAILIDFGIIVSQKVIDYFSRGIINSHFSLLPEWRGADPISFSILGGQKKTGVSLMLLTAGMDEGPLLAQADYDMEPRITTPALTADLIELSDLALREIIPLYLDGQIVPMDQMQATISDSVEPTYSRKLTKSDGIIDWHKSASQIEREIRAFIEWPKTRTKFGNIDVIITAASTITSSGTVGQPTIINKKPVVFCGKDALVIEKIKPAGKKEMTGEAFLAGYKSIFLAKS